MKQEQLTLERRSLYLVIKVSYLFRARGIQQKIVYKFF